MRIARLICSLLLAVGSLAIPAQSRAQVAVGISVQFGPPELPVYEQPQAPAATAPESAAQAAEGEALTVIAKRSGGALAMICIARQFTPDFLSSGLPRQVGCRYRAQLGD
jgi:hypothetical protein